MINYKKYINALRKCAKEHENDMTFTEHIVVSDLCRDTADLLETLEQKPKIGHWINGDSICPCCGENKFKGLDSDIWADWKPKHCPNCGAKMVETQNLKYADNDTMMPAT